MYELCAGILGCHLIGRVETPRIVKYGESLRSSSFAAGSNILTRGVIF
jgi:hypothetical protein